jgi:hypothetical protein
LTYEDVLDNVNLARVLAEATDTDAVATVAGKVLDNNVCAVGLEGYAVVAIVDVRVLDDNIVRAISVPAAKT